MVLAQCCVPTLLRVSPEYETQFTQYKAQYPALTRPVFESVYDAANTNNVKTAVVLAVIEAESRFNPNARSYADARGLMQVMGKYWYHGNANDLYRARTNVMIGTRVLRQYLDMADGNIILALQHYNAGPKSTYFNGPYIVRIMNHVARSEPDTPLSQYIASL